MSGLPHHHRSSSEIVHVGVHTQPRVVCEVPAHVIGIVVDHNRIAVPQPVIDVAVVPRRDTEVKAIEPEPAGAASLESKDVAGTEPAGEAPMRPRPIEVIVRIIAARIVSDPRAVGVNVGSIRMSGTIAKVSDSSVVRHSTTHRRRTVFGNVSAPDALHAAAMRAATMATASTLRKSRNGTHQRKREKSDHSFHTSLLELKVARHLPRLP